MHGRLKEQGLQALLKELSRGNPGMCVITTRVKVADIENTVGRSSNRIFLENLSDEAGAQVLESLGVKGTKKELKQVVREYEGHALALNLLGTYIAARYNGDIKKRDKIKTIETDKTEQGRHARKVMKSYEIWLKGKPELNVLYLMGLFDRPAPIGAIEELRREPVIKGLTDKLKGISEEDWDFTVGHLRELRLLAEEDKNDAGKLDCHPLVREHFGEKLRENNPAAWREAHGRLYEYYKSVPEKERPDTLEEMEPLFAAVAHGCAAGRHQETLEDVFWERINRGKEAYSVKKLGAFGADLAAMAGFFEKCWSQPAAGLTDGAKAFFLNWAGFHLRAVGRLHEAAELDKASLDFAIKNERWRLAAVGAINLSDLYLTLGDVKRSVEYARQSVEYADKSGDKFQIYSKRAALADALHQAGKIQEAEDLFREAEQMQRKRQGEYEYLYSVQGYQFCDLLLSQGKYKKVLVRAEVALKIVLAGSRTLLDIALNKLSLARAFMLEAIAEETGDFGKAREYFEETVEGLRKAGVQDYLPRGLLVRAELYRVSGEFKEAWRDVEEAREIAERGEMKLFMADCALEACRLLLAQKQKGKAKEELKRAKELIEKCGYHRRDREVAELEREVRKNRK
jgi:tetratricopeptide (TPR) repeat protein